MIDQQIIDGFLDDQQAMLGRLAKIGFCRKSVIERAISGSPKTSFDSAASAGQISPCAAS
jgi:hypothetical protein